MAGEETGFYPVKRTHIGGFEMDQCQMTIDLCNVEEEMEAV